MPDSSDSRCSSIGGITNSETKAPGQIEQLAPQFLDAPRFGRQDIGDVLGQ